MDRFSLRFGLGYVSAEQEMAILADQTEMHPLEQLRPCADRADVHRLRRAAGAVAVSEEIRAYVVALVGASRRADGVRIGASPRASLAVMKCAQALALFDGLDFVTPDHVQEVAVSVIAHRLVMDPEARYGGLTAEGVVEELLAGVPVPT